MLICSSLGFRIPVTYCCGTGKTHSSLGFDKGVEEISKLLYLKGTHGDYPAARFQNLAQTMHFTVEFPLTKLQQVTQGGSVTPKTHPAGCSLDRTES